MGNEGKDKPSHTLTREEVEQRYPGLKIIDATDEMIGKTTIFPWFLKPLNKQSRKGPTEGKYELVSKIEDLTPSHFNEGITVESKQICTSK